MILLMMLDEKTEVQKAALRKEYNRLFQEKTEQERYEANFLIEERLRP